jgi:hypothetical protein
VPPLPAIPAAAAATAAAALAMSTAAAPTALARSHWTRFIHHDCAAHKVAAVARLNRALARRRIVDVYKTESPGFTRKTVPHYIDCVHGNTRLRKKTFDIRLAGTIWQVADKKSHETNLLISIWEEAG